MERERGRGRERERERGGEGEGRGREKCITCMYFLSVCLIFNMGIALATLLYMPTKLIRIARKRERGNGGNKMDKSRDEERDRKGHPGH